jgi:hypothetical protein
MFHNGFTTIYLKIKTNSLQVDTSHRTLLVKRSSVAALSSAQIKLFPSTQLNSNFPSTLTNISFTLSDNLKIILKYGHRKVK